MNEKTSRQYHDSKACSKHETHKAVLTHNETKTLSDTQDELCNEEQMSLQNKMERMENTEEESEEGSVEKSEDGSEEESELNPNPVCKKIKGATQNKRKRNYPGQINIDPKRMKTIKDVDWSVVCHIPSEARHYGRATVKEIKTLRKELNVRSQRIRDMKRKISNLQSLLAQFKKVVETLLKKKGVINEISKET